MYYLILINILDLSHICNLRLIIKIYCQKIILLSNDRGTMTTYQLMKHLQKQLTRIYKNRIIHQNIINLIAY